MCILYATMDSNNPDVQGKTSEWHKALYWSGVVWKEGGRHSLPAHAEVLIGRQGRSQGSHEEHPGGVHGGCQLQVRHKGPHGPRLYRWAHRLRQLSRNQETLISSVRGLLLSRVSTAEGPAPEARVMFLP